LPLPLVVESPKTACVAGACVHEGQLESPSLLPSDRPSPGPPGFPGLDGVSVGVTVGSAVGVTDIDGHGVTVGVGEQFPGVGVIQCSLNQGT